MVKKSIRESVYFILMAVLFYLGFRMIDQWITKGDTEYIIKISIGSLVYALVLASVYFLAGLNNSSEGFGDHNDHSDSVLSDAAMCKGGSLYTWQGDDPISKKCRELASTPQGRCQLSAYTCPNGYIGTPKIPFVYTPLSGDGWENDRCKDEPTPSCIPRQDEKGRFTAFERTAPF